MKPLSKVLELIETINEQLYSDEKSILAMAVSLHFKPPGGLNGNYPMRLCEPCMESVTRLANDHKSPVIRELAEALLTNKNYEVPK